MKKNVWVIDDDTGILEVSGIILEEAGFTVNAINTKDKLFEALKLSLPDAIFLDITIAGVDGRDICKKLKADHTTKDIPVIIMSANTNIEKKMEEAKADDFLKKPFDILDLEEMAKKYTL